MRALFFMLLIVLLGLYLREQEGFENGFFAAIKSGFSGGTYLEVGIPQNIILHGDHRTLSLPIVLRLKNNTDKIEELKAEPCKAFRYIITTDDNAFKQSAGTAKDCTDPASSRALGKGETLQDLRQIFLDTKRYQLGDYKLRVRFWGYEAEEDFSLIEAN